MPNSSNSIISAGMLAVKPFLLESINFLIIIGILNWATFGINLGDLQLTYTINKRQLIIFSNRFLLENIFWEK